MKTTTSVYIRDEVCEQVKQITLRELKPNRLYDWLWACLIRSPQAYYTQRQLKRFLFVGFYLNVDRNFPRARAALQQDLKLYRWKYADSVDLDTFVAHTAIAATSNRVLTIKGATAPTREPKLRSAALAC